MRRSLAFPLTLVLVAAVLLAGCTSTGGSPQQAPASGQQKMYIVGIDAEYPPYSYLDPNGTPTGFDVDSMRWIAEKKGLNVTFQPTAWDGMIPSMDAGRIDMVYSGMTITPERAEKVNFSIP
ncbi:MAG: amino acid ABC transporter substrate-binding protein, partial [Methanomicrobiales archaeon]|nr:amino acid ABC transporter substrate-binding protein [Methanomicrobiales archaeon]